MGHRASEEVTLGVEQRLDISHSWGLIIWCRNRDEGLVNVVYGSILCQKTFGQALIWSLKEVLLYRVPPWPQPHRA